MRTEKINKLYPNVRDYYILYEDGKVYSEKSKKFLSIKLYKSNRYLAVSLQDNNGKSSKYLIHRMLAMAFKPVKNMKNLQ